MEYSECGLACLTMILHYYKNQTSLNDLRSSFGTNREGYSLYQLLLIAKEYNLDAKAYQVQAESLSELKNPAILYWNNNHYVVLDSVKKGNYTIVDPAQGRLKLSREEFQASYSGYMLSLKPSINFKQKRDPTDKDLLKYYFSTQKITLVKILLLTILLQIFAVSMPILTKWITDELVSNNEISYFYTTGFSILAILVLYISMSIIRNIILAKLQTDLDLKIMENFFSKLYRLKFSFFDNRSTGDLIFRANSNTQIRQVLSSTTLTLFVDLMLLITYSSLMLYYNVSLTLIIFLISVGLLLFLILNTAVLKRLSNLNLKHQIDVQSHTTDSLNGIIDVKTLGLEKPSFNEWKSRYITQLRSSEKLNIWNGYFISVTSTLQILIPIIVLWMGSLYVTNGEITVGTLIAFSTIASGFLQPILSISSSYTELVSISSYFQRVKDVIYSPEEKHLTELKKKAIKGKIEFQDVYFRYHVFSDYVLKGVSFTININETVALVGASGSGKSTILKLILGFYTPDSGRILIDDVDINNYNIRDIRSQIGTVMQESSMFNKTISENLTLNENFTMEEVVAACKTANIHSEIDALPLKYETMVSEKGANFSGGQRQRLLIARAILKRNPILVLDEATSALDNKSEATVAKNLELLNCTRIIIAHRLSTVKTAERILVFSEGNIVEEGNHNNLLTKNGFYTKLYNADQDYQHHISYVSQ